MDKIQKLKELQNKIATGDIESSVFNNEQFEKPELFKEPVEEENFPKKAFDYSLRLLSQRDYSVFKMTAKLKSRGFDKAAIEQTIQKLHSFNYLREEEYTKGRIKQLILKGYSNSFILHKLSQEGLTGQVEIIEEIRTTQDLGTESQIIYLIDKKLRGKEIPEEYESKMKLRNKVTRFLISKGFGFSDIGNHLNERFK